MTSIIQLLFSLLLLGGAGFGGWTLYNTYIAGKHFDEETKKKEAEKPPPPVAYVRLSPIVVPMIGENRAEQFVTVVVTVEVAAAKQFHAQSNVPRLIDAFIATMYGAVNDKSILNGGLVNIPAVKEILTGAANKVLGPGVTQDVLVQVVTQRTL
ncbi:MAG TPA: hypothetical protein VD978_18785 [Azospirillum sp.]|nr:hypothetical protein [Azospirillum sp.]